MWPLGISLTTIHRDAAARGQQAQQDSGDREADAAPPGMMDAAQGQAGEQDRHDAGKDAAQYEYPGGDGRRKVHRHWHPRGGQAPQLTPRPPGRTLIGTGWREQRGRRVASRRHRHPPRQGRRPRNLVAADSQIRQAIRADYPPRGAQSNDPQPSFDCQQVTWCDRAASGGSRRSVRRRQSRPSSADSGRRLAVAGDPGCESQVHERQSTFPKIRNKTINIEYNTEMPMAEYASTR